MDKKLTNYFINVSFFAYFVILITERVMSLVTSLTKDPNMFPDAFTGYGYIAVILSIVGFIVFMVFKGRDGVKALFNYSLTPNYIDLVVASGIILISGMIHLPVNYSVVQFISYGILIIGILLKVLLNHKESKNKPVLWLSFAYLVAFSMAIPVSYPEYNIPLASAFMVYEAFVTNGLIALFVFLTISIFSDEDNLFRYWWAALSLAVLDTLLIVFRSSSEINYFVLIFLALSVLIYIAGLVILLINKKKEKVN